MVAWWSRLLCDSYRALTGRELAASPAALYDSPVVVLSHGTQPDPILNYGNAAALRRWDVDWATFVSMPSSATVDDEGREHRVAAFARVREHGFITGYRGMRVDRHGNRFEIADVTIWEVRDAAGTHLGDAAAFPT